MHYVLDVYKLYVTGWTLSSSHTKHYYIWVENPWLTVCCKYCIKYYNICQYVLTNIVVIFPLFLQVSVNVLTLFNILSASSSIVDSFTVSPVSVELILLIYSLFVCVYYFNFNIKYLLRLKVKYKSSPLANGTNGICIYILRLLFY